MLAQTQLRQLFRGWRFTYKNFLKYRKNSKRKSKRLQEIAEWYLFLIDQSKCTNLKYKLLLNIIFKKSYLFYCSTTSMPYTEALIAETLRYSTITPQGVQHRAMRDQEFHGYLIPKDTVIKKYIQLWFSRRKFNCLLFVKIIVFFEK